jgi:hypothetical protein
MEVNRAQLAVLLELVGREPARVDPVLDLPAGCLVVDPERDQTVDRQASRRVLEVVALDGVLQ